MPRTIRAVKTNLKGRDVTVPAGQRVQKCPDSTGQYFAEDLDGFIDAKKEPILFYDAVHYGIRIDAADVSDPGKE